MQSGSIVLQTSLPDLNRRLTGDRIHRPDRNATKDFYFVFGHKNKYRSIAYLDDLVHSRIESEHYSPADIMNQGAFICTVRVVQDNTVQPVQQIISNFVSKAEFIKATVQAEEKN